MRRILISFVVLAAATAHAQSEGSATPAPTTATPAPAPTPATPAPVAPAPAAPHEPLVRIRAGADGAPAVFVPGIAYGVSFSGRIGVQLKKMWGAYLDVGGGFGFGGSISAGTGGGGVSLNVADYWRLGFMGEADIGRLFFISFGPGLCGCTYGGVSEVGTSSGSASQAAYVSSGIDAMLLARVGLGIGHGRNRFTIALENMVVFGKMTEVSQNASMNGAEQSVRIGNLAVGWAPALVFGWDMR